MHSERRKLLRGKSLWEGQVRLMKTSALKSPRMKRCHICFKRHFLLCTSQAQHWITLVVLMLWWISSASVGRKSNITKRRKHHDLPCGLVPFPPRVHLVPGFMWVWFNDSHLSHLCGRDPSPGAFQPSRLGIILTEIK